MEHGLMHRAEAFMAIHDPQNRDGFNKALRTLRYEEALHLPNRAGVVS